MVAALQRDYTLADVSIIQLLWKRLEDGFPARALKFHQSLPILPMTFDENAKTNNVRSFDTSPSEVTSRLILVLLFLKERSFFFVFSLLRWLQGSMVSIHARDSFIRSVASFSLIEL